MKPGGSAPGGGYCDCEVLAIAEQVVEEAAPDYKDLLPSASRSE